MLSNLKTNRKQRGLDLTDMAGENLSFQQAQESGSEVLDWFIWAYLPINNSAEITSIK